MTALSKLMRYYDFTSSSEYNISLKLSGAHHIALCLSSADLDNSDLDIYKCTVYLHDQLYVKSSIVDLNTNNFEYNELWAWLDNRRKIRDDKVDMLLDTKFYGNDWFFKSASNNVDVNIMHKDHKKPVGKVIFFTDAPLADNLDLKYSVQFYADGLQYKSYPWGDNDKAVIKNIINIINKRLLGLPKFTATLLSAMNNGRPRLK